VATGTEPIAVVDDGTVVEMTAPDDTTNADGEAKEASTSTSHGRVRVPHSDNYVDTCLQLGMDLYTNFSDVPHIIAKKVRKSLFPPTEDEKQWMNLGEYGLSHLKIQSTDYMFQLIVCGAFRTMRTRADSLLPLYAKRLEFLEYLQYRLKISKLTMLLQ
jgi:hypothetical protein